MAEEQSSPLFKLLIVVCVLAAGVGGWFVYQAVLDQDDDQTAELTEQDWLELERRFRLGIAYLENKQFDDAAVEFEYVDEQLPDEPEVVQNLAIARILHLVDEKLGIDPHDEPDRYAVAVTQASEALNHLLRVTPESSIAYLLAGKYAAHQQLYDTAQDALRQATELATDDATMWFAAAQTAAEARDKSREVTCMQQTYKLKPDNLWVVALWLPLLAEGRDPLIIKTLDQCRPVVEPLGDQIQALANFDVLEAMDQARASAVAKQWDDVMLNTRIIGNVLRPQIPAKIDQRRIDRNLLEYIVYRLDSTRAPSINREETSEEAIEVRMVRQTAPELSELTEVQAVEWVDFDLDDIVDLVVLQRDRVAVFGGAEDGSWKLIAELSLPGENGRLLVADLDRDYTVLNDEKAVADPDVVVYGAGGLQVLRNRLDPETSSRRLEPVELDAGLELNGAVDAAALVDFDHDGDLDIVLVSRQRYRLLANAENFVFQDVSNRSRLPSASATVRKLVPVDWNQDLAIDVLVFSADAPSGYLENLFHSRFRWQDLDGPEGQSIRAGEVLDADANGAWDLLAATGQRLLLLKAATHESGNTTVVTQQSIEAGAASNLLLWDYDNDGRLDILRFGDGQAGLLRANRLTEWTPAEGVLPDDLDGVQAAVAGDRDADGDLDLALLENGRLTLLDNSGGNAHQSIAITIQADYNPEQFPSQRVNMQGIGSLIEVRTADRYQSRIVTGQSTHFGLGTSERPDVVRVVWTDGVPTNEVELPREDSDDQSWRLYSIQTLKGSCPYVYTWTGERFEFFTDCLWAAPIGLQFAEGVLARPREWEYLRIDGDRLQARDGHYEIQLTEELWEIAYFDQVQLVAVDHPAEVDIFSNEKVGPPQLSTPRIRTVRDRRPPVSATASDGRDLTGQILSRDGDFAQPFTHRLKQGLTPLHHIELDLGSFDASRTLTLYLTGWVFPTDTSLNVAIGQNPHLDGPQPPRLLVADGSGGWKTALENIGFPGGKTKTIAVDLDPEWFQHDSRLRIQTSMQLCWDEVFYSVDEAEVELRERRLSPESADLHFRGRFTRYGDVTQLLTSTDARLVVMGAGDELTVRFAVPAEKPPEGWERDFLLYNVGWDKDADLNTVYGQTTEPLPFAGMTGYPIPPHEQPDSDDYESYLSTYQTRVKDTRRFWRELLPAPDELYKRRP